VGVVLGEGSREGDCVGSALGVDEGAAAGDLSGIKDLPASAWQAVPKRKAKVRKNRIRRIDSIL
jgi:hypothetical protein